MMPTRADSCCYSSHSQVEANTLKEVEGQNDEVEITVQSVEGAHKGRGGVEDSTLKITIGDAAHEQWRCAYEAWHVVTGYFGR